MADREPTARDMHMAMMLEQLEQDPKTRGKLHELVAEKFPDHAHELPDVAARKLVEPVLAAIKAESEALLKERQEAQQQKNKDALDAALRGEGVRDDELPDLYKYMREHNTLDPKLAVMGYRQEREVAAPTPPRGAAWGVTLPGSADSGDFFKGIMDDPRGWRRRIVAQDLHDYSRGLDPNQTRPMLAPGR